MDISIVIPTYNNHEPLHRTLAALSQQTFPRQKYEVIVVEDGSAQSAKDLIDFWKAFFNLKYYRIQTRSGISRARNIGIEQASGRVVVFLDADMIVTPEFLSEHSKMHQNASAVGIGYRIRLSSRVPPVSVGDIIHNFQLIKELPCSQDEREDVYQICDSQVNNLPTPWVCVYGCNFSVLREDVIDAGKFDEQFQKKWGGEDIEFAYRLYKKGLKFILNRNACGYHIFHHSNWSKNLRAFDENLFLFLKKHPVLEVELYKDNLDITLTEYIKRLPIYLRDFHIKIEGDYLHPQNPSIIQWLKASSSGSTLIVGCINERLPIELDASVVCVPSKKQAEQWKVCYPERKWMNLIGSSLPYDNQSFDTIILTDFIQYLPKNKGKQILRESARVGKKVIFCHQIHTTLESALQARNKDWALNKETLSEIRDFLPPEHYKGEVNQKSSLLTLTVERNPQHTKLKKNSSLRVHINLTNHVSSEFRYCLKELAIALDRIGVDISCQPISPRTQQVEGEERTFFPQREQQVLISLEQKNIDYIKREYIQFPGYHFFVGHQKIDCVDIACQLNHAFDVAKSHFSSNDAFCCLSSHTLNQYLKMGANPKQARKILFGINPELFAPDVPRKSFDTQKGFIFLSMGLPTHGEGFDLLLEAFIEEFSALDDVCLVLKIPSLSENWPNNQPINAWLRQWRQPLEMVNQARRDLGAWIETLADKKGGTSPEILIIRENERYITNIASYYAGCDCFVKPMRTSGFDLNIVEAMACGKPVITTEYGSVLDYCQQQNSYLIRQNVTGNKQGNAESLFLRWSEPDKTSLKQLMRFVYEHREKAEKVGLRAAEQIRLNYTWNRTAQQFVKFLLDSPKNLEPQQALTADLKKPTLLNLRQFEDTRVTK